MRLALEMGAEMTNETPRLPYDAVRRQHKSLARTLALLNNSGVETATRQILRQQAELRSVFDGSLAAHLTELSSRLRKNSVVYSGSETA